MNMVTYFTLSKKLDMKELQEKDVYENFKEVIYKLYPIKKPRMELKEEYISTNNANLKIVFCFYKSKNNMIKTQMYFVKDNNGMSKFYFIDDKLSNNTVGKLISFILKEFPYVRSIQTSSMGFDIECVIGLEQFEEEGISCSKVNIVFNSSIKLANEFDGMFQDYLNYILSNYMEYMSRAPQIKEVYKKYRSAIKKDIINSLTRVKLEEFINLLSDEELRDLLIGMNTDNFFKVCDKFDKDINKPKSLSLERRIYKK